MVYEDIKNIRLIRYAYYCAKGILQRNLYKLKAEEYLNSFGIIFANEKKTKTVIKDMVRTKTFRGYNFDEYIYYRFYDKSKKERNSFVADWEHLRYACKMNNHKNDSTFDNKWETYNKFKPYYLREVVIQKGSKLCSSVQTFIKENNVFVVKPLDASCGNGVQIIHRSNYDSHDALAKTLLEEYSGQFIAEELILQNQEMADFHPASLNTVRIPTIRLDNETLIIHPFMRIGQHGKNVDNAGAGGIICAVDAESGIIFSAADEHGNTFDSHPETGKKIIGFKIPRWDEAKEIVKQLAQIIPDNRYTGWDVALSPDGWKLVEANRRGQFVWQIPMQIGFRKEINSILKKIGKKH